MRAQNLPRDANSSSEKGDRPPRGSGIADMSPSNENRSLSPTDHVYSSRSQMERARARDSEREHDGGSMNVTRGHEERQSDMEATDHVYSSQSQMERAMESEKQRERDATTTAGRRQAPESWENMEASRGLDWEMRSEFERIRDDISGFLGVDLERTGVIRFRSHELEVYRARGGRGTVCAVM